MCLIEEALQGSAPPRGMPEAKVEETMPGQMYETGTMANIQNVTRGQDNTLQVVVQGINVFVSRNGYKPRPTCGRVSPWRRIWSSRMSN